MAETTDQQKLDDERNEQARAAAEQVEREEAEAATRAAQQAQQQADLERASQSAEGATSTVLTAPNSPVNTNTAAKARARNMRRLRRQQERQEDEARRSRLEETMGKMWQQEETPPFLMERLEQVVKPNSVKETGHGFEVESSAGHPINWEVVQDQKTGTTSEVIRGPGRGQFKQEDAEAMVALARTRGWGSIDVTGTQQEKEMIWLAVQHENMIEEMQFKIAQAEGLIPMDEVFEPSMVVANFSPDPNSAAFKQAAEERAGFNELMDQMFPGSTPGIAPAGGEPGIAPSEPKADAPKPTKGKLRYEQAPEEDARTAAQAAIDMSRENGGKRVDATIDGVDVSVTRKSDVDKVVARVESEKAKLAAEAPKAEAPKVETPKTEAPAAETPKAEKPATETPKAAAPKAEAPKTEAPKADKPKEAAPAKGAPKADAPKAETLKAAETSGSRFVRDKHGHWHDNENNGHIVSAKYKNEEVAAGHGTAEPTTPRGQDAPAAEKPKASAPKAEAPKANAPKADKPKEAAPAKGAPKADAPKAETPKAAETSGSRFVRDKHGHWHDNENSGHIVSAKYKNEEIAAGHGTAEPTTARGQDAPKAEAPKPEKPAAAAPKADGQKPAAPVKAAPKAEAPKEKVLPPKAKAAAHKGDGKKPVHNGRVTTPASKTPTSAPKVEAHKPARVGFHALETISEQFNDHAAKPAAAKPSAPAQRAGVSPQKPSTRLPDKNNDVHARNTAPVRTRNQPMQPGRR